MNRIHALVAGLGIAASLLIPATANASTAPSTVHPNNDAFNCAAGYVCLYSNTTALDEGHWANRYFNYRSYPFVNEFGEQWLDNNQTGGAVFRLCLNGNGTNCTGPFKPGFAYQVNLTPYNSILLSAS